MIVKSKELGMLKVYMVMVTNEIYYIIYINGNNSQIIKNNQAMDYDTAAEIFNFLIDKKVKIEDTESSNEIFSQDEYEKLMEDIENIGIRKEDE